jgi:hypothetical protein
MACTDKIAADILNSCDVLPVAGYEKIAWAINREDIDVVTLDGTYTNLITAITKTAVGYTVTAVKKEMNGGFDLVTSDNMPDTFSHFWSFQPFERDAAAIANIDDMNDIVLIVELKGSKVEGCFVVLGLEMGLYKTSASQRQNDNNGLPTYEFGSMEGQGERYGRFVYWITDYDTTKALIVGLET